MRILIACEFSGLVRDAFLARGHEALSCDLEPTERPGPHYQGNVRDLLGERWDMMVAFPPCTYLSAAGARWWKYRKREQQEALDFVQLLMNADIPRIAIENPQGIISTLIRKPDQVIQPYFFGHEESKRTCLWLKNLPSLMSTCLFLERKKWILSLAPSPTRGKERSRTFPNIAYEMARQWGGELS